jgi:hypothetical protein
VKLHDYFSGMLTGAVNLNPDRLEQLAQHEKALTDWLRSDTAFSSIMGEVSRQGSWAHRTIIKPLPGREFDADLLVQMKRQGSWSKDPKRYPQALYDAMLRSPRHRDKVKLKTRCVRVTYAGDCHVDLVPYLHGAFYELYERQFIVNRKTNEFERVNPEGFVDWFRKRDRTANGHLRTSLRLLKYLRDYKGTFDIPSVILTVLVGGRANGWLAFFERYCDMPSAFHSLVAGTDRWLQAQSRVPQVPDPSCSSVNFGHRLDDASFFRFRDQFHRYADTVRAAYKTDDLEESIQLWRDIFGSAFAPTDRRSR